jgi:mannose-6-phosphate isomerase
MDRVWGGRRLESCIARALPPGRPIGESWELVDRADVQSIVNSGPLTGASLHDLWTTMRAPVFGDGLPETERFPLLAKILDARDTLSVQVHPPAGIAPALGGEPKTEMWYLLDADAGAALYAGFRKGTTRADFEQAIVEGSVESLLHKVPVQRGDAMFIPSGRCHAIGSGCFIIEIQQNSDTTFRVFDWNRTGLDGKPRELHIAESLASIDFADHEPSLAWEQAGVVAACPLFKVERWDLSAAQFDPAARGVIFTVIAGSLACGGRTFRKGDFFLLPAASADRTLTPLESGTAVLRTTIP